MECSYSCQFCHCKFNKLFQLKKHIITISHYQKLKDVFPNDEFKNVGVVVPHIIFVDPLEKHHFKYSIVGLSAVTLCFSPESRTSFYLCHICEEKCLLGDILRHFSSLDHYTNYINCKHPDAMSFSWIPNMDMREFLSPEFKNRVNQKGREELQLLHLPKNLLEKLKLSTYSEVMLTLSENEKFLQLIQAFKPERMTIQTYQKDSNRKHPLLGMQHLVECICVGPDEKKYYLCTLCGLTVGAHVIIKHILSFDHIFWYFKMWHPSTLLSKECYREYTPAFESMILDFSKQTEAMHRTAISDMKQVSLEPAEFKSVNFKSYAEALKTLESIKKCSLKTAVKPGKKLVCADKKQFAPAIKPVKMLPYNPRCKVLCQDCSVTLGNISHYIRHLSNASHQKMMWRIFDAEGFGSYTRAQFHLGIHSYVMECFKKKQPVIGTALIVSCITTEVEAEPFYVCFACRECVRQAFLEPHLLSRKHVVHTLLFENPWRLPFGWENLQDEQVLRSEAWEEEKERRPTEIVLKVLDVPFSVFVGITPPTFGEVLNGLEQQHDVLKNEVPPCQTYSKLQQNEPFPLLGMQFVVMYDLFVRRPDSPEAGFLCLLCERRLSNDECHDHVFSREHVAKFLDAFHPGSLTSQTDAETLLDLATQAAKIQTKSHIQVVYLHRPIEEPYNYLTATYILGSVMRKYRKRNLKPQIRPERKLVPRVTVKVEPHVKDDDQKNNSTSTVGVKNTKKEMPLPSKDSESQSKEISQTEKMKGAGDACGAIKQEPEEANTKEPTGEEKSCHNASEDNGAETGTDKSKSSKDVPAQLKIYKEMERKRPHSVCETSQEDPCSTGDAQKEMGEICHKRQHLNSREDSCEEAPKMIGIKIKEEKTDKAAMDKGLSALLKCCCHPHEPIYLCESCSLKISERDIVSHLTGFDCHKVHLVDVYINEDIYNNISKQSFHSAIQAVRAFQTRQDGGCKLPSSSASSCKKTAGISIDRHDDSTKDNMTVSQVVKKEIDDPGASALITATSKITQVLPPSNKEDTQSDKVPKPANKSVTCPTIPRRSGETLSPHVSGASGTNTHSKAGITPNTSVKSTKIEGSSNVEDVRMLTTFHTATTTKHTPASSQRSGTSRISKASVLSTKPTAESAVVCRTRVALRETASLNNAPLRQTESRVVQEATCKTAPSSKSEIVPKPLPHKSKTKASPQMPSVTAAKKPKTTVISENVETSAKTVHVKNSVGPNAPHCYKSTKPAAAPHQASGTAVRPEYKKPPPEPSQTSTSKTKAIEGLPKVGLNELIVVLCEEKQQVYCKLCSVKLTNSSDYHLVSLDHWMKYVKTKYPDWTTKSSEMEKKLNEIATPLAKAEKKLGPRRPQIVKVKKDVYEKLAHLPEDEAIRYVKAFSQSSSQVSSASPASASPCDVSSLDDGINMQHNESHKTQSDDLIQDDLQVEETAEVTMDKPCILAELPDIDSDSDTFAQYPDRDTCDHKTERWKSEKFQDPQKLPGGTQKATPVQFGCLDKLSVAAAGPSEGQNQLKPSQRMEHVPKRYPGPEEHSASWTIFKTTTGRRIGPDSNLSIFLKMKGLDNEPIIGQDCVLECRGIALETFFLCMCCQNTISHRDICQHIVSFEHQLEYVRREYPQFLNKFWEDEDLPFEEKQELLKKVSWMLSERERALSPEVITLRKEMHEWVRTAPFGEALEILQNFTNADQSKKEEMVQDIKSGHKHGVFVPQQNKARQTQEPQLEKTATVSGLDGFKERRLMSLLDLSGFNPKDDFVVSPLAHGFSCCSPQETCSKPPIQPQFTPPVSEYQWPVLSLHVKQEEEHSESPCSSTAKPNVSQMLSVPPRDECLPSRKRPADISVNTLLRSCTSNPLEDPLPAKFTSNKQQPVSDPTSGSVSQSASVNSAAVLSPLSHDDKDTGSISGEEDKSAMDWGLFAHLISRLRRSKSQVADSVETFGSCAASSSKSVEMRWDSHCMKAKSELPVNKTGWGSKCQPVKATVKKTPSLSSLFKSVPLPGNHTDTGFESQPVSPSGSSANILCSPDHLTGNPTEVEATSSVSPTATTAEPRDPQHPQSVPDHNLFENMGQFSPSCSADTSHNTGRILQPHADSETHSTGVCQLPISTIVTNRPKQNFMGSYQEQHHTEVNRDHQVSFPTVPTANPTEFLAPSGGYNLYGQLPYVASGHPGYPPSEAILSYTTADNPHVYTGTLSPSEAYSAETIYPATQLAVSHSSWQLFGQAAVPPGWVSVNMMQYYPSVMRR